MDDGDHVSSPRREVVTQGGPIVEHRINERLGAQRDSLVERALRDRGGQAAARTCSAHGDAVRVDAQFVGVFTIHCSVAMQSSSPAGKGFSGASR